MVSNIDPERPNVGVPRLTYDGLRDNFESAKEEIEELQNRVTALEGGSGGGEVSSVFGRVGAVTSQFGDYTADQINSGTLVTETGTFHAGAAHIMPSVRVTGRFPQCSLEFSWRFVWNVSPPAPSRKTISPDIPIRRHGSLSRNLSATAVHEGQCDDRFFV